MLMNNNELVTVDDRDIADKVYFQRRHTDSWWVYNYEYSLIGELRRRRINKFRRWVLQPVPVDKLGELFFADSTLRQVRAMIVKLRGKRKVSEKLLFNE
jgi:hypothetical protein